MRSIIARTSFCTRARLVATEIRKAFQIRCSKQWRRGLPVFATEHGGIPEAIEKGVSGVLVPERDDEAVGASAAQCRTRSRFAFAHRARGGPGSEKTISTWAAQAQRLEDIYLRMIGRPN